MSNFAKYPSLAGKSVLVSGGASGIGAAFVENFSRQGAKVAFLDVDQKSGDSLVLRLASVAHRPVFITCDVTDLLSLESSIEIARQYNGPIDVLVNNAASDNRHEIGRTTSEMFDRNVAVNLKHQYFAIQAVLPDMRQSGGGSIICLGSTGWMRFIKDYPLYATAKAAVRGLVRGLTRHLGPDHIRINCLVPGWVITEKQREMWLKDSDRAYVEHGQALPGYLLAEDLARAALFLASDDSRMCTGQDFIVDGGWA